MDHSRNKKGRHELKRKQNRKRMRLHKHTIEGKIGPEGKDLPHHHAWSKPLKAKKTQTEVTNEQIRSAEIQSAGCQQINPAPSV